MQIFMQKIYAKKFMQKKIAEEKKFICTFGRNYHT